MNRINSYVNGLGRGTRVLLLALAVIFVGAGIAQATAATTISSTAVTTTGDISTTGSGTLSIAGLATFLGGATTTQLKLLSGDTIKNASASSTAISGSLILGDTGATRTTLVVTNGTTATSTITVGCVNMTATSSLTATRLVFSALGATSTFSGTAYWAYGSCP